MWTCRRWDDRRPRPWDVVAGPPPRLSPARRRDLLRTRPCRSSPADHGDRHPFGCRRSGCRSERTAQRHAVGRNDLDGVRKFVEGHAIEEPSFGQTYIGEEVAVSGGLFLERTGDVGSSEQAGDGDIPSEEVVVDRKEADV